MTISNLIERGNPEDMDEDLGPETGFGTPIKTKNGPKTSGSFLSKNVVLIGILILTSAASFGLGMLTGQQGSAATGNGLLIGSIPTTQPSSAQLSGIGGSANSATTSGTIPVGGEVVGSSVTHAYYLPWCSQATAIQNADKVWFATEQMAKSAGYIAGKGCAGL